MDPLLDLELLRTFAAVVEYGELKKAAQSVCRSHAAVSMQMKRLEQQLDVRLMERSNQGIRLTEAGQTLLGYSEQFIRLNRETLSALAEREICGRISFGIPTDYAQDFLESFMPILIRELPNLEARVHCDRSRNLRRQLAAGELDVAIVAGEPDSGDEQLLWTERLIWAAPVGVRLEDLDPLPVALHEDNCIVRDLAIDQLKRTGIRHRKVFGSTVLDNVAAAVRAGFATALLPESLITPGEIRSLSEQRLASNSILRMNMICSSQMEATMRDRISGCLQMAAGSDRSAGQGV